VHAAKAAAANPAAAPARRAIGAARASSRRSAQSPAAVNASADTVDESQFARF
jgi:hypothetical protein